jgi:hypothetical protein
VSQRVVLYGISDPTGTCASQTDGLASWMSALPASVQADQAVYWLHASDFDSGIRVPGDSMLEALNYGVYHLADATVEISDDTTLTLSLSGSETVISSLPPVCLSTLESSTAVRTRDCEPGSIFSESTGACENDRPSVTIGEPDQLQASALQTVTFPITLTGAAFSWIDSLTLEWVQTGTADCEISISDENSPLPTVSVSQCMGDGTFGFKILAGAAESAHGTRSEETTLSTTVSIDNTGPSFPTDLARATPSTSSSTSTQVILSGTSSENGGTAALYTSPDCSVSSQIGSTSLAGGDFSITGNVGSTLGLKSFYVILSDVLGNATSCTDSGLSYTLVSTGPPPPTITSPTNNSNHLSQTVTLSGTCVTGNTVQATLISGSATTTSTVCASSTFYIPVTFAGNSGRREVQVSQTDSNSNTSAGNPIHDLYYIKNFDIIPHGAATFTDLPTNSIGRVYHDGTRLYAATTAGLAISSDEGTTWTTRTPMQGLGSSWIYNVFVDGANIYTANWGGGVSISHDSGQTFTTRGTSDGIGNPFVSEVIADASGIYAATYGGGLSISTNGGVSFTGRNQSNGLGSDYLNSVFKLGSQIYVGCYEFYSLGGLSISSNGGSSFTTTSFASQYQNSVTGATVSGSNIYIGTQVGLYVSNNSGTTMSQRTTTQGLASNSVGAITVDGSNVYVATGASISKSTDNGGSFTATYLGANVGNAAVHGSNVFVATQAGLAKSTNSGANYTLHTTTQGWSNLNIKAVQSVGTQVFAATSSGLYVSHDSGQTFSLKGLASGLPSLNLEHGMFATAAKLYVPTDSGLAISTDSGEHFTTLTTSAGLGSNQVIAAFVDSGTLYVATAGGLSISTNDGLTFVNRTVADGLASNSVNDVFAAGTKVYLATPSGLNISTNGGGSFVTRGSSQGIPYTQINRVYASGNTIYAGTAWGLALSTDGGDSFTNKTGELGTPSYTVTGLHGLNGTILIGTEHGMTSTINGGSTFSPIEVTRGLASDTVQGIASSMGQIYIATASGLSRSQ